ncbi:MAG: response regulator receiver [Candidatus Sulfotelmatobacter sp.]|nr:response regulator receiver [Candidatus Sulfotelmatobacter sp.]
MNCIPLHAVDFRVTANRMDNAVLSATTPLGGELDTTPARRIAIVDDDKWVLKSLERLVKSAGFKVETFISAEDFLQSGNDSATICVILDIGLPGMSGLDLQRQLIAENSQVPIIFVSAHDESEMQTQALAGGAIAFLCKPFNDKALLDAVSSAVK